MFGFYLFKNEGSARQLFPNFLSFWGHKPWIVKEFIPPPTHVRIVKHKNYKATTGQTKSGKKTVI